MKAYVLDDINKYSVKEVAAPQIGDSDVLVEVKAAGICGSDIPRVYTAGTYHYPLIPGHEFSGVVKNTGKESTKWINKRVGVFPLIPCMKCEQCLKLKYEMCTSYSYLGSRTNGGYAEYVRVPEWNLIELPASVSYEQAAMLEPMAVSVHAARNAGLLGDIMGKDGSKEKDVSIAIMGLGAIGMSLAMMLVSEGYSNISVIGNKEIQKEIAIELGIKEDSYIDLKDYSVGEKLYDIFFDCVGTKAVVDIALNSVKASGKVCLVGNPASDIDIPKKSYWQILRKQLTLVGTWNSSFTHSKDDDWNYVINKLASGEIHPEKMISHNFGFDELMNGFELMRDKSEPYIKVMGVF